MEYVTSPNCHLNLGVNFNHRTVGLKNIFKDSSSVATELTMIQPSCSSGKPKWHTSEHKLSVNPKLFQPPPFVVGGFVGSKSVEHKNWSSSNYSNLLGDILNFLTDHRRVERVEQLGSRLSRQVNRWIPVATTSVKFNLKDLSVTEKPHSGVYFPAKLDTPVSNPTIPTAEKLADTQIERDNHSNCEKVSVSLAKAPVMLAANRSMSESSESSWASVDGQGDSQLALGPIWLRDMIVCGSDIDSDSDWDCVDDFHSENGEIVMASKWEGEDRLSPIAAPSASVTPIPMAAQDDDDDFDYDSDDSDDGVRISCIRLDVDADEERRQVEEKMEATNRRWQQGLDQTDGAQCSRLPDEDRKRVHFPSEPGRLARIRPMLAWDHAYRAARKGGWEQLARDAGRFRERIASTANVLAPVLDPAHRQTVWRRLNNQQAI